MRRRLGLSTLLIGMNVGLVLVVIACVLVAAVGQLRRLADESALERSSLAAASALERVQRSAADLVTSARLLAAREHPLAGAQQASGPAGYAIVKGGAVLAHEGETLPWEEIARVAPLGPDPFLLRLVDPGALLLGARAQVPGDPGSAVIVGLPLDAPYAARLSRDIGLDVTILDRQAALAESGGVLVEVRRRALDSEAPLAERVEPARLYVAVLPLQLPAGAILGVIQVGLPTTGVDTSVRRLVQTLLALAIGIGALASLFGFIVGRRLVGPIEELTSASARIGRGDLSTPIPRTAGAEIGALAATMEEMRGRLLRLTAELQRRQGEAEAILTGIVEGVFAVDRERRILYLNPQAAALLGTSPEHAVGRFCGDVLRPEPIDGIRPCEERCPIVHARFSRSASATEHLVLAEGGRRSVVITSSSPEPGGAEEGLARAGDTRQFQLLRDETDIEATRRLRDTVLANISHEFRTPLTAQLASIELLRERIGELGAEEALGLVLSLERGTLRLTQLIDNLLESVRIEAGRDSIRRAPVALDEVVEEAIELTSQLIVQRQQELEVELPYPLPLVTGDAPRLIQVFVNLLANANKFAPPDSRICVGGAVAEETVALWVEDEGPGLPPEGEDSVFARFIRSPGEEPSQGGMGLGLWIVKSIVERHGGRVEAGGGRNGTGTRISVVLPRGPRKELA